MRATLSVAALAAFVATSSAVVLPERASCPSYEQISCSGEYIVGKLYVRNPDNSLHIAAFAGPGKKLATKYNGTPSPDYAQFALKRCSNQNIDRRDLGERQQSVISGFIVPNGHRYEALTLSSNSNQDDEKASLYADKLDISCSNDLNTRQYFDAYVNHTSSGTFYSLAYSGIPTGATPGGGYGPVHSDSSNGDSIFISEKYTEDGFNLSGFVNPFGYSLELHP